jgi:short-subunit dehydrogenase
MKINNDYALITGASSGFGLSLAKEFSKNGHNTILVARDAEKLKSISEELKEKNKTESFFYKCDLSSLSEIDQVVNDIRKRKLKIKILVNNAGISNFGLFEDTNIEKEIEIVKTNIISYIYLTKLTIPLLKENTNSKILNVSSMVGNYPLPYQAVYAASKSFVLSFSQSISAELALNSIQVSTLLPGNIKTPFIANSGLKKLYEKINANEIEPDALAIKTYNQFMKGTKTIYYNRKSKRMIKMTKILSFEKIAELQFNSRGKYLQ